MLLLPKHKQEEEDQSSKEVVFIEMEKNHSDFIRFTTDIIGFYMTKKTNLTTLMESVNDCKKKLTKALDAFELMHDAFPELEDEKGPKGKDKKKETMIDTMKKL